MMSLPKGAPTPRFHVGAATLTTDREEPDGLWMFTLLGECSKTDRGSGMPLIGLVLLQPSAAEA
jgi:hypothetical protein